MLTSEPARNASKTEADDGTRSEIFHASNPRRDKVYARKARNTSRLKAGQFIPGSSNECEVGRLWPRSFIDGR